MAKVTGRTDDLMIVRGVNIFPTQVEELVLALPGLSPYFQCVLTRPGRLDELEVVVEAGEDVPAASYGGLGGELAGRIKDRIGVTAAVRVVAARRHRTLRRQGPPHRRPPHLPLTPVLGPGRRIRVWRSEPGCAPRTAVKLRFRRPNPVLTARRIGSFRTG